jgi:hypothetical protein
VRERESEEREGDGWKRVVFNYWVGFRVGLDVSDK